MKSKSDQYTKQKPYKNYAESVPWIGMIWKWFENFRNREIEATLLERGISVVS